MRPLFWKPDDCVAAAINETRSELQDSAISWLLPANQPTVLGPQGTQLIVSPTGSGTVPWTLSDRQRPVVRADCRQASGGSRTS